MFARRVFIVALLGALLALPASAYAAFQYPEAPTYAPNPSAGQGATRTPSTQGSSHGLVAPTYVPKGVVNGVYTRPATSGSRGATGTYALDWTIGMAGKSGCLVCHGDANLVRIISGRVVSMHMDTMVLQRSAHANNLCTSCHTDFAQKQSHPTPDSVGTWREVAKNACKNCHLQEYSEWAASAHSGPAALDQRQQWVRPDRRRQASPGQLCGDCHKAHSIPAQEGQRGACSSAGLRACDVRWMPHAGLGGRTTTTTTVPPTGVGHLTPRRAGSAIARTWSCHRTTGSPRRMPTISYARARDATRVQARVYVGYAALVHSQHAAYEREPGLCGGEHGNLRRWKYLQQRLVGTSDSRVVTDGATERRRGEG